MFGTQKHVRSNFHLLSLDWDEKLVTYDNIVRKRSWSKSGEASQMVTRPGLTPRKVLCAFGGTGKESSTMISSIWPNKEVGYLL